MKKLFLIFTLIFVTGISAFADKSWFYENGKVIDTMYVDSLEGLRVRDKPSLKSNRICGLTHRFPVKVVAVGGEETIDGITAPWIEILLPRYEWKKKGSAEFGGVFGGYLSENLPEYKEPSNAAELKQYLEYSYWRLWFEDGDGALIFYGFFENDNLYIFPDKDKKIKELALFRAVGKDRVYSDGYSWVGRYSPYTDEEIVQYLFVEGTTEFTGMSENGISIQLPYEEKKIAGLVWDFYGNRMFLVEDRTFGETTIFDTDVMLNNRRVYAIINGETLIQSLEGDKEYIREDFSFIDDTIKMGISAKGTKYEEQYHDYWNPVMAEHQKKADAMN